MFYPGGKVLLQSPQIVYEPSFVFNNQCFDKLARENISKYLRAPAVTEVKTIPEVDISNCKA